jgi:spore maturation protein CgeB
MQQLSNAGRIPVRFAFFYHSARSDWNHGNAHFLRGLVRSLTGLGHSAVCYEGARGWSVTNLVAGAGLGPLVEFRRRFPFVDVRLYDPQPEGALERRLEQELYGMDVVVLHEWPAVEQPALLQLLLRLRPRCGFRLLFHDTHYRMLTQPSRLARLGLERCDAILAFGPSLAATYRERLGLGPETVHVVHEAADDALFRPLPPDPHCPLDDALFVGNWGGPDRASELRAFLFRPARRLRAGRRFALYGVRYPPETLRMVQERCGIDYRGWLPNHRVPQALAQARAVLHIPRRQYVRVLHGTPTIRVFEVLSCAAPLISTYWPDTDGLFRAGTDYVVADTPQQMEEALRWLWRDEGAARRLGHSGRERILAQHTCRHRALQILDLVSRLRGEVAPLAVQPDLQPDLQPVPVAALAGVPLEPPGPGDPAAALVARAS